MRSLNPFSNFTSRVNVVLVLCLMAFPPTTAAAATLKAVAVDGDSFDGLTITHIRRATINASGHVAFVARVTGELIDSTNDSAIFIWRGRAAEAVVWEGDPIEGYTLGDLFWTRPVISDGGAVVFSQQAEDGSGGVFVWNGELTRRAIALGTPCPDDENVTNGRIFAPYVAPNGSFTVHLPDCPSEVFTVSTSGDITPTLPSLEGHVLPDGTYCFTTLGGHTWLNDSGDTSVVGQIRLQATGCSGSGQTTLWSVRGGSAELVGEEHTTVFPDSGDGRTLWGLRAFGVSDDGDVLFGNSDNPSGAWLAESGGPRWLLGVGEPIPGYPDLSIQSIVLDPLRAPLIDGNGDVALAVSFSSVSQGVVRYDGSYHVRARTGEPVIGEGAATFDEVPRTMALSRDGRLALSGLVADYEVAGASRLRTGDMVLVEDDTGALRTLVAEGRTYTMGGESVRFNDVQIPVYDTAGCDTSTCGTANRGTTLGGTSVTDSGLVLFEAEMTPEGSDPVRGLFAGSLLEPATVDLVGLEVVQVVQDWNNSITLVAGKPTLVRAHFEAPESTRVQAVLHGTDTLGEALPGSPLPPDNFGGYTYTVTDAEESRDDIGQSLVWDLPASWRTGILEFEVEPDQTGLEFSCLEAAGPAPNNCRVEGYFAEVPDIEVALVGVYGTRADGTPREPSREELLILEDRLRTVLPVQEVDSTMPVLASYPKVYGDAWDVLLKDLLRQRVSDGCANPTTCPRIYYGVLGGRDLGGLSVPRYGVGAGTLPLAGFGLRRPAHEVIHMLGWGHTPFCTAPPTRPDDPDVTETPTSGTTGFPSIYSGQVATIGPVEGDENSIVYGWNARTGEVIHPREHFDLMSYCGVVGHPFPDRHVSRWPAAASYEAVLGSIDDRFGEPEMPAEPGEVLFLGGDVNENGQVEIDPLILLANARPRDIAQDGRFRAILQDAAGNDVAEFPFDLLELVDDALATGETPEPGPIGQFALAFTAPQVFASLIISEDADILGTFSVTENAPTVEVTFPNGGDALTDDSATFRWTAADADDDELTYAVSYSADNGASWQLLATGLSDPSVEVTRSALRGSTTALIRVQASDGLRVAVDTSDSVFTVANNPPVVVALSPASGRLFGANQRMVLEANAFDLEDGERIDDLLAWSSDVDGALATGAHAAVYASDLTPGEHIITVTATDSGGETANQDVSVRVVSEWPDDLADLGVDLVANASAEVGDPIVYEVVLTNHGPELATETSLAIVLADGLNIESTESDLTCAVDGLQVNCPVGDLARHDVALVRVTATADDTGVFSTAATTTTSATDPDAGSNSASFDVVVVEDGQLPGDDSGGDVPDDRASGDGPEADAGDVDDVEGTDLGEAAEPDSSGGGGGGGCCRLAPSGSVATGWFALFLICIIGLTRARQRD